MTSCLISLSWLMSRCYQQDQIIATCFVFFSVRYVIMLICKCLCAVMFLSDINECEEAGNACDHSCINLIGSYICRCADGYNLAQNQRSCQGKRKTKTKFDDSPPCMLCNIEYLIIKNQITSARKGLIHDKVMYAPQCIVFAQMHFNASIMSQIVSLAIIFGIAFFTNHANRRYSFPHKRTQYTT